MLHGCAVIGSRVSVLEGSWDLVTTWDWAYNPTSSPLIIQATPLAGMVTSPIVGTEAQGT